MFLAINWNELWNTVKSWLLGTGIPAAIRLIIGVVVMFIVFKIINVIFNRLQKKLKKENADKTVSIVLVKFLRKALKVFVFVVFLGFVGVDTASIGALVASAGVTIGLALQGGLSNIAGGIIILLMRPFRIDDYIKGQGEEGTVEDIKLFYTTLRTPDNKVIMVPNGALANGNITNYSLKDLRRVDLTFTIAYESDYYKANKIIVDCVNEHPLILKDKEPFIRLSEHASSGIVIACKSWVNNGDYWTVYFDLLENVKNKFDEAGIVIPYQQLDVHVKND
jgi:small conductance mechanosensitive channel